MPVAIPIDKMTTSDKLRALEHLWDNLQCSSEAIPSPAWHEDVLHTRETRVQKGSAHFEDWSHAKKRIRNRAR